ncbi:MAG: energy transducer TonB [Saprospiraceae bacterium]
MKKERKDKDFIKAPYLEGGKAALESFVKNELRYPKEALKAKIEGTVSIRYTVDYKGKIIDANVIASLGYGCDEEALRIVRSLKFKVPNDGKITSKFTRKLHIHFRLPGSPAVLPPTKQMAVTPEGTSFSYQYQVTTTAPKADSGGTKKGSYDITITIS